FAPGRAGADPDPRGAGPEAGDRSAAQTCSSAHPAEAGIGFGGVLCFQKAKYWDQLPSLSSESKREDATARFLCRGFPYESSRGIPCSAYTGTYPIPGFKAPALRLPTPSGRNLKNSAQNLVRMEPGKIATHYSELRFPLPEGFRYDEESRIILDPDEDVRRAVASVFRLFRQTESPFSVM